MSSRRRSLFVLVAALLASGPLVGLAVAHGGGIGGSRESMSVPTWLVLATGGAAVGASFLLASTVTDRALVRAVDGWRRGVPGPGRVLVAVTRALGVAALVATVVVGVLGPRAARANLAALLVWVVWWAGYTASTYLVGNTWRALNPWRTVASVLPSTDEAYPARLGAWPATVALLALVWLEVASPVADAPRLLVTVVLAYTAVTLTGVAVYGTDWFRHADPVARVFDHYGRVAPLTREDDGLAVRLPGAGLPDLELSDRSEVGFVVALLWVTTFDGLVGTPAWASLAGWLSAGGVPPWVLYPVALLGGFALFLGVFLAAARASRRVAETRLTAGELARQFAPSLLAIAAGYHLAHYLGYFLSLAPAVAVVATSPLDPPAAVPVLALPDWFGLVGVGAILLGHVLAVWVAHATAYDIFPGRLQAVRSQYPFVAVMVFYTATSLWILSQPEVATA